MAVEQTTMLGQLPYSVLLDAILAHPTIAEGLTVLFTSVPARSGVRTRRQAQEIRRRNCGMNFTSIRLVFGVNQDAHFESAHTPSLPAAIVFWHTCVGGSISRDQYKECAMGESGVALMTTVSLRLVGTVRDICRPGLYPDEVERVTVSVDGAEPLYAELRLPNTLRWSLGQKVVVVIVPFSGEHESVVAAG